MGVLVRRRLGCSSTCLSLALPGLDCSAVLSERPLREDSVSAFFLDEETSQTLLEDERLVSLLDFLDLRLATDLEDFDLLLGLSHFNMNVSRSGPGFSDATLRLERYGVVERKLLDGDLGVTGSDSGRCFVRWGVADLVFCDGELLLPFEGSR